MIVAGCVMFTWVVMVGWPDVCCSESGEMWGVDESEGGLHLGKRWLVDYDDGVCVCVCVCVCVGGCISKREWLMVGKEWHWCFVEIFGLCDN